MKCREAQQLLDDYVDGSLGQAGRTALEDHLKGCAGCRSEATQLQVLLDSAGGLSTEINPGRDLWPCIHDRIEAERESARPVIVRVPARRIRLPGPVVPVVVAAALLIAVAGSLIIPRLQRGMESLALLRSDFQTGLLTTVAMERHYAAVTENLFYSIAETRSALPESTLEVIDEYIQIIDAAIEDSRAALENDPSDVELQSLLSAAHRQKVGLLQWTTQISTPY